MAPPAAIDSSPAPEVGTMLVTKDNMVQHILETGIKEVPARFRHMPSIENHPCANGEMPSFNPDSKLNQVPVIDLSAWFDGDSQAREKVRESIGSACREWGFFQVVNHHVPEPVLQGALQVTQDFFDLPFETKEQYAMKPGGFIGYGTVYKSSDSLIWNDILAHQLSPKHLNNMDTEWPDKPSNYRKMMDEYQSHVQQLGTTLYELLSTSLGLHPSRFQRLFGATEEHNTLLRVNLYPRCPQPELTLGSGAHSDASAITILQQSNVPGLQIRLPGKPWMLVEPVPDALVVNVGDCLEMVSNGLYKSIEHRAIVNSAKERFSLAVFFLPPWNAAMGPLAELINQTNPPRYSSVSYFDYVRDYLNKGAEGKKRLEAIQLKC